MLNRIIVLHSIISSRRTLSAHLCISSNIKNLGISIYLFCIIATYLKRFKFKYMSFIKINQKFEIGGKVQLFPKFINTKIKINCSLTPLVIV